MTKGVTNRVGRWQCWTRTLASSSVLALVSALAWPAFGQSAMALSTARELAKEGLDAYDAQRFEEAADKLLRAFAVVRVPTLAVNAARALVKINKPFQASELYLQAMQLAPAPDWQPVQQEMQAVAAQERAALLPKVPRLAIQVEGAKFDEIGVVIDGVVVPPALLGVAQMVEPGSRRVVGRRGSEDVLVEVQIAEGETKTALLRFSGTQQPTPLPPPVVAATPPTQTPTPQPASAPATAPVRDERQDSGHTQRMAGWISVGVGGAGVLFGTVTGLVALSKKGSLEDDGCVDTHCHDEQQADVDSYNGLRNMATAGFIIGGIGAAAGVTLLLTSPSAQTNTASLRLGPGSLHLQGRF